MVMAFNPVKLAKVAELTGKTPEEIYENVCEQVLLGNTTLDTYPLKTVGCKSYREALDKLANGEKLVVLDEYLEEYGLSKDSPKRTIIFNVELGMHVMLDCNQRVSILEHIIVSVLFDALGSIYRLVENNQ